MLGSDLDRQIRVICQGMAFLTTPDRVLTLVACGAAVLAMVILSRMNLEESPSTVSALSHEIYI